MLLLSLVPADIMAIISAALVSSTGHLTLLQERTFCKDRKQTEQSHIQIMGNVSQNLLSTTKNTDQVLGLRRISAASEFDSLLYNDCITVTSSNSLQFTLRAFLAYIIDK